MKRLLVLKEKILFFIQALRINLYVSLITLIGLSIALSTVSSSLLYLETSRSNYYLSLLEQDYFEAKVIFEHQPNTIQNFDKMDILTLQEALEQEIQMRGLEREFSRHPLSPIFYLRNRLEFLNQSDWDSFYAFNFNESILADCIEGSYLPTTMNQTILLTWSVLDFKVNDQFNISFRNYNEDKVYYTHTLQISGIITPDTLRKTSPLNDYFFFRGADPNRIVILTDLGEFTKLFGKIDTNVRGLTNSDLLAFTLMFRFNLQVSHIGDQNAIQILPQLVSFLKETGKAFRLNGFYLNRVWQHELSELISNVEEFNFSFFYFLILCIPIFSLTILLVGFSLRLTTERRKKRLTLFQMRGISSRSLMGILFIETLVISLMASLISIIPGTLGCLLILTTSGFLTFNFQSMPALLVIPQNFFGVIFIISVCFTSTTYLWPMFRLIKSTLPFSIQNSETRKKTQRSSFIGNLDLFLFIQGLLGLLVLIFIMQVIKETHSTIGTQLLNLLLPLIFLLVILSPFSFLIGFIFTYNRFIPSIIQRIGNYCWKKDWGLLATASRNLAVDITITRRTTLLTACTLSFLMILSSLPLSYYHYDIDQRFYNVGADVSISGISSESEVVQDLKSQLTAIGGLNVTIISRTGFDVLDANGVVHSLLFLGIEENFLQVAHWRSYYDDQPLSELVLSLFNSSELYPVLIDTSTAREANLTVKNIYRPFIQEPEVMEFSVINVNDFWPGFILTRQGNYHYLITKRELIENISKTIQRYAQNHDDIVGFWAFGDRILGKLLPEYDPNDVMTQIMDVTSAAEDEYDVVTARSRLERGYQKLLDQFLWIITNFNFVDSLIIVLIVISLFTLMRLSGHATELGLSRALGMKYPQVFFLMFMEPLLLFLISGIPGGFVGLIILAFFAAWLSPLLLSPPPFLLTLNFPVFISIYGTVFAATAFAGGLTALLATRANISKILMVE
ncbi:MAG: FtsX-like permease family protein [Candidatus Thorarchaeota archaeon]